MIALGGPKLKQRNIGGMYLSGQVSMIALGGPKLKQRPGRASAVPFLVSMIALGGPKLKPCRAGRPQKGPQKFQ